MTIKQFIHFIHILFILMFSYVKDLSIRDDLFLEETLYDIPLFNPFHFRLCRVHHYGLP